MTDHSEATRLVSADTADRVLMRAATLDAAPSGGLSVTRLREVAAEAGISSEALETALEEESGVARGAAEPIPSWVRVCLFGVPDRAAALRFYWIFVAGMIASPLLLRLPAMPLIGESLAIGVATFCFGALWSTSRAVRWADRHGWQQLP